MAIDQLEIQYLKIPAITFKEAEKISKTQSDCFFLFYVCFMYGHLNCISFLPDCCTQALISGHGLISKMVSSKCFMPHAERRHPELEAGLSSDSASMVQDVTVRNKQRFELISKVLCVSEGIMQAASLHPVQTMQQQKQFSLYL